MDFDQLTADGVNAFVQTAMQVDIVNMLAEAVALRDSLRADAKRLDWLFDNPLAALDVFGQCDSCRYYVDKAMLPEFDA